MVRVILAEGQEKNLKSVLGSATVFVGSCLLSFRNVVQDQEKNYHENTNLHLAGSKRDV